MGSNVILDSTAQSDRQLQISYRTADAVNVHVNSTVPPLYPNSTQVATPAHTGSIAGKHQADIPLREARSSSEQVPYSDYSALEAMEVIITLFPIIYP